MSEIIKDVMWFCGSSNVGIVKVKDPYDGYKYYIVARLKESDELYWTLKWKNAQS